MSLEMKDPVKQSELRRRYKRTVLVLFTDIDFNPDEYRDEDARPAALDRLASTNDLRKFQQDPGKRVWVDDGLHTETSLRRVIKGVIDKYCKDGLRSELRKCGSEVVAFQHGSKAIAKAYWQSCCEAGSKIRAQQATSDNNLQASVSRSRKCMSAQASKRSIPKSRRSRREKGQRSSLRWRDRSPVGNTTPMQEEIRNLERANCITSRGKQPTSGPTSPAELLDNTTSNATGSVEPVTPPHRSPAHLQLVQRAMDLSEIKLVELQVKGDDIRKCLESLRTWIWPAVVHLYETVGLPEGKWVPKSPGHPSHSLETLYATAFGQEWRGPAKDLIEGSSITTHEAGAMLVGAALHRKVFTASVRRQYREPIFGIYEDLARQYSEKAQLPYAALTRVNALRAIEDPRYESNYIVPAAAKFTGRVAGVLKEHLSYEIKVSEDVWRSAALPNFEEELVPWIQTAFRLKHRLDAGGNTAKFCWYYPGTDFDSNEMSPVRGASYQRNRARKVAVTLLSGARLRNSNGEDLVASRAQMKLDPEFLGARARSLPKGHEEDCRLR